MFLDNLSGSILRICGAKELSYETASELCGISPRYFGDIVRKRTAPTITTLEKICTGLEQTPNELLGIPHPLHELTYRSPMKVSAVICRPSSGLLDSAPVCPRCQAALERELQPYCGHCGQKLDWSSFGEAAILFDRHTKRP